MLSISYHDDAGLTLIYKNLNTANSNALVIYE